MTLVKYNNRFLNSGIFDLLSDIFREDFETPTQSFRRESIPAVNVKENEKAYDLEVAVPGMDKKDINLAIEDHMLIISSEMKEEKKEDKESYSRREFHYNAFKRTFNLPEEVEESKIEAHHENGVLHIRIPKKEAAVVVKKQINIG